jgi:hypothetical protein
MNNEYDKELFSLAVQLIRGRRHNSLEVEAELEKAAISPLKNARDILYDAEKYVKETDEAAFECAVEAFKQGQSHFEVSKKLIKCGMHPWDSDVLASRAKERAEKELAEERDIGLSALGGEFDGQKS